MHELGVLRYVVRTVGGIAEKNRIGSVKHITLEVGEESGYVPFYLEKLFPVAVDAYPVMQNARLKICMVPGKGLQIRDIGYRRERV